MIAFFLSNISAKYYKNPSMLSRVIAKKVGDVFLRHSVYAESYTEVLEIKSVRRNKKNYLVPFSSYCGLLSHFYCRHKYLSNVLYS